MPAKCETFQDVMRSVLAAVWISVTVCSAAGEGQDGDGCGHTVLGPDSGTLASQNYPGTYPDNSRCTWRLRVAEGRSLQLLFGDFDIESSPGCSNGSLVITDKKGEVRLGPVCGRLDASQKNMTLEFNEATVSFRSGPHRSGRGFLLSYATDQYPDLISCLHRGSHFSSQDVSVYCPAGCQNVTGDVWGNSEQGYRDTSVLCKSAVHAGAASDRLGGRVGVTRGRSLTLYESTFANGVLSKTGSLSEKKLLFRKECNNVLNVPASNASSLWDKNAQERTVFFPPSAPGGHDQQPWAELELSERSTITGIITIGSDKSYMTSFILLFSKDRKTWKPYKDPVSRDAKVFQAHAEGHLRVLNSLVPPAVARFLRLQLISWSGQASTQVQVLGCPSAKVTPRSRAPAGSPSVRGGVGTPPPSPSPTPTEAPVLVETKMSSGQPVMVAVGVALALLMCGTCLLAGVWWKQRKKESQLKYSLPTGCQSFQAKTLPGPPSDLISYPLERNVHDALPSPPLNDYAEPAIAAVAKKPRSTFRPSSEEGYTTPYALNHYDTPSSLPEYAEPLPPEPEYATPFSEQPSESHRAPPCAAHYDCPSHRMLPRGYCAPAPHACSPRPTSAVYAEPKPCDSLLQKHTYEEPL